MLKVLKVNIAGGRNVGISAGPVARLHVGKHGLYRAFRRRGRSGGTLVDRTGCDQRHGQNSEHNRQNAVHYLASLRTGCSVVTSGNSMVSVVRLRSGSRKNRISARMLLPMGSVPQSSPSMAVGLTPKSVG